MKRSVYLRNVRVGSSMSMEIMVSAPKYKMQYIRNAENKRINGICNMYNFFLHCKASKQLIHMIQLTTSSIGFFFIGSISSINKNIPEIYRIIDLKQIKSQQLVFT